MNTEEYEHHGRKVTVVSEVKGQHKSHCLCFDCEKFKPDTPENCVYAQHNFSFCVMPGGPLVLPVYECEDFKKRD